uniref:Small ribosomal subunit protein uS15 N-terminal domain-containing protein n=1 Tax=Oryza barthii TaxID=65489 RepID=A0A0D3F8V2_9ORYZ
MEHGMAAASTPPPSPAASWPVWRQRHRASSRRLLDSNSGRPPAAATAKSPWKGISSSALPCKRIPPSLLKNAASDVEEMIMKAAKMGQMSSQIGVVLRHQHGIPLVKSITSSKILHILKAHGLAPKILEDLYFLIKKAVAIRKHLERNRKDKDSKFQAYSC